MYPDYRETFPSNEEVHHIEFGAGLGYFGKKEFPNCFLTDLSDYSFTHFNDLLDPTEIDKCHFLDKVSDYYSLDVQGRKFNKLIFCNPFGYGFRGKNETAKFLKRAEELLNVNGEIFVVGQVGNRWVKKIETEKWINLYNQNINQTNRWEFIHVLNATELSDFNSRHHFRQTSGQDALISQGYVLRLN